MPRTALQKSVKDIGSLGFGIGDGDGNGDGVWVICCAIRYGLPNQEEVRGSNSWPRT